MQTIAVILPAGKLFDRVFEAISATARELGPFQFIRISTDLSETQLTTTLNELASSITIIADVTARNPHVMFLVGCARALKKQILYITQHAEDFPFAAEPIVYGSDLNFLRTEVVAAYCGPIEPRSAPPDKGSDARAKFLSIFGDLLEKYGYQHRGPIEQNEPNVFTLVDQDMDLPLVQEIARRARELNLRVRLM